MNPQNPQPTSAGGHVIARRIEHEELAGLFRQGLEVRPGTRALLFVGGRYAGTLPPGRHTLDGVRQKLRLQAEGRMAAVVVDDGELALNLEVGGVSSADHHRVSLSAQASIRLTQPELFLANLFRDRSRFLVSDLAELLSSEVRQGVGEMVATHRAADLHHGRVRTEVEIELLSRWKSTFERHGFALQRLPVLDFELPAFDAADGLRSEAATSLVTGAAERDGRAAFFEAELEDLRLDIDIARRRDALESERELDQLNRKIDRLERRNPLLKGLLEAETMERMSELESEEEWRQFKSRVDRRRLLDEAEWAEIQTAARRKISAAEAEKLRQKLEELRLDTEIVAERARQQRLELQQELEGRRMVFDQEAAEQKVRLELDEQKQQAIAGVQLEKIRQMEEIRQGGKAMARDRDRLEAMETEVREVYERAQRLDHEKFLASLKAGARHHEEEKDRMERIAVKKGVRWRRCPVHEVKYPADEGCPLCARERSAD